MYLCLKSIKKLKIQSTPTDLEKKKKISIFPSTVHVVGIGFMRQKVDNMKKI